MQFPRQRPIGAIRRYKRRQGESAAIGEQQRDFGDASDILVSVSLAETEVFVEAEADVVAVETVGGVGGVEEVLFEGGGDGGFPAGGEAGEPDC